MLTRGISLLNHIPRIRNNQIHFPKKVNAQHYSLLTRIRARLGRVKLIDDRFLSYCKNHDTYYVDNEHTNGSIRCPSCDQDWLIRHHMINISYV
jgi:hypothetical protein